MSDTLVFGTRGRPRLSPMAVAIASVVTFAALVAGATALDRFDWTMPTLREQIERATDASDGSPDATQPGTVPFDVALIKGSTTLAEVADAAGIPASVFTAVYGVPADEQPQQLKSLKDAYGCSPGEVRAFVTAYAADPAVADTWEVGAAHAEEEGR